MKQSNFPVINSSSNRSKIDYRGVFDNESRQMFHEIFKKDINLLGYDFDSGSGVPPRIPSMAYYLYANLL
ncbi:hypothetical protein [Vreelandella titanicae]|uniref:hypothetical protein n=1 Tax=Vreelandella titanicae TaxID=664683 RepID=UPI001144288D|nr:hypothetical protein [Halomonas titanicae]